MLVLSRRAEEKIVFPALGVTLHLLRIKGNIARIGIEAPPEIRVLREELEGKGPARPGLASPAHLLRNQLGLLTLTLHLFRKQRQHGLHQEADATLARIFDLLDTMENEMRSRAGAPAPARPPARPYRTLVVEDDANQRALLAGLLQMNGCSCATAVDGVDALDYLKTNERPDVVLLDMVMPRCDGPETLAAIRREPRLAGLKVFAVSGCSPDELGLSTGPGGVDGWFRKPLDPRKLWAVIRPNNSAAG
jgi:carbon storage regulator CsrA